MRLDEPACRCAGSGAPTLMPCKVIIEDDAIIIRNLQQFWNAKQKFGARPSMVESGLRLQFFSSYSSCFGSSFPFHILSRGICNMLDGLLSVFVPHLLWSFASFFPLPLYRCFSTFVFLHVLTSLTRFLLKVPRFELVLHRTT